jgi:hypothetical protein
VSNVFWLAREISIFCRQIKDAQRAHKPISLANTAQASRSKANIISHDEICRGGIERDTLACGVENN